MKETLEEAQKKQFNYDNLHDAKEISSHIKVVERSYSEEDLDAFRKFMIQEQNFSKSCLDVFVEQLKKK